MEDGSTHNSQPKSNEPKSQQKEQDSTGPIQQNKPPTSDWGKGELNPPPPDGNAKGTKKKCRYTRDPGMFWVSVAALVAVIIYASFAYQQAVSTEKAANAAASAAETARQTLESTQRAYLGILGEPRTAGGEIRIPISNYGHSAATINTVSVWLVKVVNTEQITWKMENTSEPQTVLPGSVEDNAIFVIPPDSFLQRVPGAKTAISIHGELMYDIGFNKSDKFGFCLSCNPNASRWERCGPGTGFNMRNISPTTDRVGQ